MNAAAPEVMAFHRGAEYLECLALLHRALEPRRYLEIGVWRGESLALASAETIAVDPDLLLDRDVLAGKPACHFFSCTSDEFFLRRDPKAILGGAVDLAFLDGMHRFEYLLRDFMNAERVCHAQSVIVLHDCLPIDPRVTNRDQNPELRRDAIVPGWWAGDVWKVPVLLKRHRPDLRLLVLDAPPTGLVLVSGLDPSSGVLDRHYGAMADSMMDADLASFGTARLFDLLEPRSTAILDDPAALRAALFS